MGHDSQRIRLASALVGLVATASFFLIVDLGGTVTGNLSPRAAIAVAIWMVPFAVYLFGVRSRSASLVGGLILVGAVLWALIALFRDRQSTAGIGVITLPFLCTLVAGLVVAVDRGWKAHR